MYIKKYISTVYKKNKNKINASAVSALSQRRISVASKRSVSASKKEKKKRLIGAEEAQEIHKNNISTT